MNYIGKIIAENKILKEGLTELENYINLPKFLPPNDQINPRDISLRIQEIKARLFREVS